MDAQQKEHLLKTTASVAAAYVPFTLASLALSAPSIPVMVAGLLLLSRAVSPALTRPAEQLHRAMENTYEEAPPRIKGIFDRVARRAGLEGQTRVKQRNSEQLNAGVNAMTGTLLMNTGLIERMDDEQIEFIIAHELGHVQQKDEILMHTVAQRPPELMSFAMAAYGVLTTMTTENFALGGLLMAGAVLHSVYLAGLKNYGSRLREYDADHRALKLTNDFNAAASSLTVLQPEVERRAEDWPDSSRFLYKHLMQTHPTIEERIERMRQSYEDINGHPPPPPAASGP